MIWWLIAGLLLLASLFLVYPFVRHDKAEVQDDADANLQIFRDQQAQLDSQIKKYKQAGARYIIQVY